MHHPPSFFCAVPHQESIILLIPDITYYHVIILAHSTLSQPETQGTSEGTKANDTDR